jgi:hypothetical protein
MIPLELTGYLSSQHVEKKTEEVEDTEVRIRVGVIGMRFCTLLAMWPWELTAYVEGKGLSIEPGATWGLEKAGAVYSRLRDTHCMAYLLRIRSCFQSSLPLAFSIVGYRSGTVKNNARHIHYHPLPLPPLPPLPPPPPPPPP